MKEQAGPVSPPLRIQTVRGSAYEVAGRRLIPVARIVSFGQGRATIGRESVYGWAGGFAQVVPLGIIEETEDGQRYVPTPDTTGKALRGMLASAVMITLLAVMLRRLIQRGRGR